jgi:oxalate decarboxylase/phosphoglucose isomerase-like protein (cupin superfamily)
MPKSADEVAFEPMPLKEGSGWYIVVTYPGGMQEHIPGFKNEAEAQAWLKGKGRQTWLGARGYAQ